jgi:hypothetical protein
MAQGSGAAGGGFRPVGGFGTEGGKESERSDGKTLRAIHREEISDVRLIAVRSARAGAVLSSIAARRKEESEQAAISSAGSDFPERSDSGREGSG